MARTIISKIFNDVYTPIPLLFYGTSFQIKVFKTLLKIPKGKLVSYQDVACMIGQKKAARAVGNAVAANHIAYLIPCHRVIKHSGKTGNYRWGHARKAAIIAWEKNKIRSVVKNK
jgi:AraC family transcriptional regulator of adaptative response/methylated-DNA-[protein]-cysteine methyltransferase